MQFLLYSPAMLLLKPDQIELNGNRIVSREAVLQQFVHDRNRSVLARPSGRPPESTGTDSLGGIRQRAAHPAECRSCKRDGSALGQLDAKAIRQDALHAGGFHPGNLFQ